MYLYKNFSTHMPIIIKKIYFINFHTYIKMSDVHISHGGMMWKENDSEGGLKVAEYLRKLKENGIYE